MKNYVVSFWYHTDNRAEMTVEAQNEICALAVALAKVAKTVGGEGLWCTDPGFKIQIRLA